MKADVDAVFLDSLIRYKKYWKYERKLLWKISMLFRPVCAFFISQTKDFLRILFLRIMQITTVIYLCVLYLSQFFGLFF